MALRYEEEKKGLVALLSCSDKNVAPDPDLEPIQPYG
jgi:hypothetical protein